jgi:hypothetical protein
MIVAVCGPGCSSVLSTASLKDLVWDAGDHAAELEPAGDEDLADAGEDGLLDEGGETAAADAERREAAIEAAVERLARLGELPPSVRMTLVETLERTEQEDWPTVVDAFAESLAESDLVDSSAAREPAPLPSEPAAAEDDALAEAAEPGEGEPHTVAKADLDAAVGETPLAVAPLPAEPDRAADAAAAPEPLPVAATAAAADETVAVASTPAAGSPATAPAPASATASGISATDPAPDLATVPERSATAPAPPAGEAPAEIAVPEPPPAERLTIQNACFASRVQAWGILDRFASDRFRPGQEVIVYFELDGLSAGESPAGHTTCIDSTLRLVAAGTLIRDWSFEPIAETCRARRHDYFARYVVRIPDDAPAGPCQLELAVTDTLSGEQATTSLPLEISRP